MENLIVVLAAAGVGKRLGLGKNKAFVVLGAAPILVHNLKQINKINKLARVVVVVGASEIREASEILEKYQDEYYPGMKWEVVAGGKERQDSIANALNGIQGTEGYVAIHDGARPFATAQIFERVWQAAKQTGAAIAAMPVKDTIKAVDENNFVTGTPNRKVLRAVQTPQIFRLGLLKMAYNALKITGAVVTDDASVVELMGVPVVTVEGSYENQKITTPEDLLWAKSLLKQKGELAVRGNIHVGSGFDVHCLVPSRKLILCGVTIPYELGLDGYSDADVALHALMDAMLGAVGMGDIGKYFPDSDEKFKDADSMELLRYTVKLLAVAGWKVGNADITIIAQQPKISPYREQMEANLRKELNLAVDALNVKATTTEMLGFVGRKEGIAAQAIVTVIGKK
ncbi:MAG: 2-C-methyl-D-erythritol 4-phosphate cytidylyltransferase [Acidaminococcaceae bacterium]|nr:2-C-methyl-D-erythritol 4-phosphate cytidylyltransferase [Acidaminococcaceae bacterium]